MAIPDNYIDKITKGNDSRMISPAADMVRVNNDNFEGETLDEVLDDVAQAISEAGEVKSVTINGTNHTPDSNGLVDLGTIKGEKGDKGDTGSVTVTDGVAQITIVNDLTTGGTGDALSAEMGKTLRAVILTIYNALGAYAFPEGKPTLNWNSGVIKHSITATLTNLTPSETIPAEVTDNDALEITLNLPSNLYVIDDDNLVITMGGTDIKSTAYNPSTGVISIANVTGDVVITAAGLTYLDVDGSDNKLAFNLDCKNPGSNTGFWTDLIGGTQFKLTDVTLSDSGAVFNGTTSKGVVMDSADPTQEAVGTQKLDVAFDAGTIEVIAIADSLPAVGNSVDCPLFINPGGIISRIMLGINGAAYQNKVIMKMYLGASGTVNSHYAFHYTGGTDIAISANTEAQSGGLVRFNGVTQSATWYDTYILNPQLTMFSIGYFNGIQAGNPLTTYFKGTIKAIRVYKTKLTEAQMAANYKVDKKRFNLS